MYNAMLDRLPEDYNGWLIRTDYRIGVQIQLCISDPEIPDSDKTAIALNLLYGRGMPDFQTAIEGLQWFLSCGNPTKDPDSGEPPVFSFEQDAGRIVSAFKKVFGLDISRERLHWFEFVPMLGDLAKTSFTDVIGIRTTDLSEISKKKQAEFRRMQQRFALVNQHSYTDEEQEKMAEFMERLNSAN